MELDIDVLINFFNQDVTYSEIDEQDIESSGGSSKSVKKWDSGVVRGPSNPLNTVADVMLKRRKLGPTGMYDPKYKWTSGRTMGKTGGSDFS